MEHRLRDGRIRLGPTPTAHYFLWMDLGAYGLALNTESLLEGLHSMHEGTQHERQWQPELVANFIWGIADDVLRDLYVRGKYRVTSFFFRLLMKRQLWSKGLSLSPPTSTARWIRLNAKFLSSANTAPA